MKPVFLNHINIFNSLNALHFFSFQEGAKSSEGVIVDYDKFIIQKINEFPVTFR